MRPRPSMKGAGSSSWAAIPIALAIVETPGECGADVAVGEGQPLGLPVILRRPLSGLYGSFQGYDA